MADAAQCQRCGRPIRRATPTGCCATCLLGAALDRPAGWLEAEAGDAPAEAPIPEPSDRLDPPKPAEGSTNGGTALGVFGHFELLEELGRGGMGLVYRARDTRLGRVVALKVILSGLYASRQDRDRFRTEAEAAARLEHPNIVPIFEVGELEGRAFYSMRWMEGGALSDRLDRLDQREGERVRVGVGVMTGVEAAGVVLDIARAVQHAHGRAILHRDIKPGNILLDALGRPYLADFGLAKRLDAGGLTLSGTPLGSPAYMSPEQAAGAGDRVTTSSDLYSLGALLYHFLTGRPPFTGDNAMAVLNEVLRREPVSPRHWCPGLDRDLAAICLKCLEKDPGRRYASAAALADDLERWREGRPVVARPTPIWVRGQKWARRHPVEAGLVALLGLLLLVGSGSVLAQWRRAERAARAEAAQRGVAEEQRRAAQRNLYTADMLLAHQALQERNLGRARALLGPYRVSPSSGRPDWRGWEWFHLDQRARSDEVRTVGRHSNLVTAVRFVPGPGRLVSADDQGTLKEWDAASGRLIRQATVGARTLTALEISRDGRRLAVGYDRQVELRDAGTWEVVRRWACEADVASVAFSPDGVELAAGTRAGVIHWSLEDGRELRRCAGGVQGRYVPGRIAYSPDGREMLATLTTRRTGHRRVDSATWTTAVGAHDRGTTDVAWAPDGRRYATVGMDGVVRLWAASTHRELTNHVEHRSWVIAVAFSPDGRVLASVGSDQRVVLWTVDPWRRLANLQGSVDDLQAVDLSADGQWVATGGQDGSVRLWAVAPVQAEASRWRKLPFSVEDPLLSPDGAAIVLRPRADEAWVWDARRMQPRVRVPLPEETISSLAIGPGGVWLAVGLSDGSVQVREVEASGPNAVWRELGRHPQRVSQLIFARQRPLLASHGAEGTIQLWDLSAARQPAESPRAFELAGRSVVLSPDATRVAIVTERNRIEILEVAEPTRRTTVTTEGPLTNEAALSPDNRLVAAATRDGWLHVWELPGGRRVARLRSQLLGVHSTAFSREGSRLAIGSGEGTVKLWDTETFQEVATLPLEGETRPVIGLAFDDAFDALIALKRNAVFFRGAGRGPVRAKP